VAVAGITLRLLGPAQPYALLDEPEVQARFARDEFMPYWAEPWPAAIMLVEEVVRRREPGGDPILEIGAGLGLAGLALTKTGYRVVISDYDADALLFIEANARLNGITPHEIRRLDWRNPPAEQFSAIIGADVLYEARHVAPVVQLIKRCLRRGGAAFISTPTRATADAFAPTARSAGLHVESIATCAPAIVPSIPGAHTEQGRLVQGTVFVVSGK